MITIGGNVCVRNGFELDYCFKEAIESLLPVCDCVMACDGESTDGTREYLDAWAKQESKLRVISYPWPPPSLGSWDFWVDWLNYCRERVPGDFHLQLDADEVLAPWSQSTILWYKATLTPEDRVVLQQERLNFWLDAKHIVPHGYICGYRVIRFGPRYMWMPSDAPHPKAEEMISLAKEPGHPIQIYHYGFLRKRNAFFKKARYCRSYWCSSHFVNQEDHRLTAVLSHNGNWMQKIEGVGFGFDDLLSYEGPHPPQMHGWLRERGYPVTMTANELLAKWQHLLPLVAHVYTWTEPHNLAFCAEEASHAKTLIEIGTYHGASALTMLLANRALKLFCVDTFQVPGSFEQSRKNLKPFISEGRCELIKGNSEHAEKILSGLVGNVDAAFIDAGHADEDVLKDIQCIYPLLRDNGIMFGHDFEIPHNDVAQGVIASGIDYDVPVPRMWRSIKRVANEAEKA